LKKWAISRKAVVEERTGGRKREGKKKLVRKRGKIALLQRASLFEGINLPTILNEGGERRRGQSEEIDGLKRRCITSANDKEEPVLKEG